MLANNPFKPEATAVHRREAGKWYLIYRTLSMAWIIGKWIQDCSPFYISSQNIPFFLNFVCKAAKLCTPTKKHTTKQAKHSNLTNTVWLNGKASNINVINIFVFVGNISLFSPHWPSITISCKKSFRIWNALPKSSEPKHLKMIISYWYAMRKKCSNELNSDCA